MSPGSAFPLSVERIRDLGAQFLRNPHRMVGQDGAYSFPVGDRLFWFFGDTLIGRRPESGSIWMIDGRPAGADDMGGRGTYERMPTNCALLMPVQDARGGLTDFEYITDGSGNIRQLVRRLPEEDERIRVWCLHGCVSGDRVMLFYQTVRMTDDGPFLVNFEVIGSGLATGLPGVWEFERLRAGGSALWWPADAPQFGAAVLQTEDAWTYLFGARKGSAGGQEACLARVRRDEMTKLERYEYLYDPSPLWGPEVRRACALFEGVPNELSVSWNPHVGGYLAVHSLELTGVLVARTAPELHGPWSAPVALHRVVPSLTPPAGTPPLVYAGKEHPWLSREDGRIIYVTYVEFEEYYPHLVEVTLARQA